MTGDDAQKKMLAQARFAALQSHPPDSWDERAALDFDDIVSALEQAYDVDLSGFLIPRERMKPRLLSFRRAARSGRPAPAREQWTREQYCDEQFALRQVEGVNAYLQNLRASEAGNVAGTGARPMGRPSATKGGQEMKLDLNLMRQIVLAVEDSPSGGLPAIEGRTPDEVGYHAHLLNQERLTKGYSVRNQGHMHPCDFIASLTPAGHEFAELARDGGRWKDAMAEAQRRGAVTLPILLSVLRPPAPPSRSIDSLDSQGRAKRETFHDANKPKFMYHATKTAVQVFCTEDIEKLGPEWSETYIYQEYPAVRHHWNGEKRTVKDAAEDRSLGIGWANSSAVFENYQGPRLARTKAQDPTKWLEAWSVPGLSADHKRGIRSQLLLADAAFGESPDPDVGALAAMRQAFNGIAKLLFDAGILTYEILDQGIPAFVWDSAIAGAWWRLASESPQNIFPERVGHYWIWREDNRAALELFLVEIRRWDAELPEVPSPKPQTEDVATPFVSISEQSPTAKGTAHTVSWPDPAPDFASEPGRTSAIAAYTRFWNQPDLICSEASLARRALVDPGDLSKWKKGSLPGGSEKKARIETALRSNQTPIRPPKRSRKN